jgi:hypothetical protein
MFKIIFSKSRKGTFILKPNYFFNLNLNMSSQSIEELIEQGKKASAYQAIDENVNHVRKT